MADGLDSWDEVAAFALTLPATEASTSYGQPAVKVRGKLIVSTGHVEGSFHVVASPEEKALLLATDPGTFWQTPHYENWAGLLVRYGGTDPDRVRRAIARAWWDRATVAQRKAFGDRPERFRRFVAIDWSGAVGAVQPGIAVALAEPGDAPPQLLGERWSREGVLAWLRDALPADTLVGLDLGPALPFADAGAYFPGWDRSPADAKTLWALVDAICEGEPNLGANTFVDHPDAARYFRRHRGRTGDRFGVGGGRLRVTEQAQRAAGLNPYSNLNLVGAAQVGKSSLTGMRMFHRLALPLWPIDPLPPTGSVLVEIYTTIAALAGGRSKTRSKVRALAALDDALNQLGSAPYRDGAALDDHRCDALIAAAWLRRVAHRPELWSPPALTPAIARTEGWTFGVR